MQLLTDKTFITQIENLTLDPEYFNHYGHIRLAYLYLKQNALEQSINKTCQGIKSYANSLGAEDKFHHTITEILVRIISLRMLQTGGQTWQNFRENNHDLFDNSLKVLKCYYSEQVLFSDKAKRTFVLPLGILS